MRERFVTFPLFLLAALILTVSAFAAGESASGRVEIANRAYSGSSFSCEAQLSGGQIQGELFAVVFAESGQMKSLSDYPAAETVQVMLQGVADTDCVKILWTDEKQMPLAPPAVLRMSANNTAAYQKFAREMAALDGEAAHSQSSYELNRLLMSCYELPDLSDYEDKMTMLSAPDNLYVLQFQDAAEAEKCETYLLSCPSVRYVERDALLKMDIRAQSDEAALLQAASDPLSWGVRKTGIGEYAKNLRKRGLNSPIVVAVVDSGVDASHPFLRGRLIDGYDFVDYDNIPQDRHGHGTHVAGTIVDCTPDMDVKIMPVRVLETTFGSLSHVLLGIDYAADNGANIINLSLSMDKEYQSVEEAISRAVSKNVTVVVAAGNKNGEARYYCPAHMEDCVTVAAVDKNLKRYDISNYGNFVDIAAPGVAVKSCFLDGKYVEMEGTSMAAPHVSAAAALLMCERGTGQTPFQISDALKKAAQDLPEDSADYQWQIYKQIGHSWSDFLGGFLDTRPFFKRTVTFDANRGTGKMDSLNVSHGETVTLTANAFQRNGYRFLGWNTKADGSGTSYLDGASLTVSGDMTLYAQWKLIEWTVTLDANDGSGKTRVVIVSAENPFAWPDDSFSRTGYELTGWNTKADGSGKPYADKASLTVIADMTLYAQWKQIISDPVPVKPISWGTTATHMDEYASFLQKSGLSSSEVIVAVVTSGVDASHPFLQGRLVAGYDFVEDDDTPQDEYDHGTHVAGIIADCTPDNVKIMPVRVLDAHGGGTYLNITMGIRYAVEHGANVICLPLSIQSNTEMVEDAIQYAIRNGITVVVAAGNRNNDAKNYCPANIEDCITVAAVDSDLKRFELSNYGEAVDIAAPGVDINSCIPDGKYGEKTGTSMCAAYVAGAAAMLMCEYGTDRTPAQISDLLKNAAMPIPDDEEDAGKSLGAGFLDMTPFIKGDAPYVMLYDDGEMVFQMGNASNPDKSLTANYPVPTEDSSAQYAAWYPVRDKIRTVTFSDAIRPVSTALWFYGCENLTEISGMENLDASQVTDMSQMFARCTSLKTLDLSAWNTGNVSNTRQMFFGCASLTAIYASDAFSVSNVTDSADMFTGCTSLIGGSGTKYDDAHTDKEYAHIDDGAYDAGYFADKTRLLFDGVELSYQAIDTAPADGDINIEVTANNTCVIGDTLVVSATVCTPDEYNAGSHKYIGYFAYQNRREWQQLRAWYIDGGASLYTLKIPVKSCPKMGSNYFVVSVFPADNFTTGASLQDCLFQVYMTQS